jgi:hypothetical protein
MIISNPHNISDDTIIWRYINLPKLLSLIQEQSLWFSRLDILTDEYEGELPIENQLDMVDDLIMNEQVKSKFDAFSSVLDAKNRISEFKKFTLINSWTIGETESYALWKIYLSNSPYGIAIKTSFGHLEKCLKESDDEIEALLVEYLDINGGKLKEITQNSQMGFKYDFYRYENELRLMIKGQLIKDDPNKGPRPRFELGKYVRVDLDTLLQNIITPPKSPDWFEKAIKSLLKKYNLSAKVERSIIKDRI